MSIQQHGTCISCCRCSSSCNPADTVCGSQAAFWARSNCTNSSCATLDVSACSWHITGHIHQQYISWQAHQQDDRHGPQQTTPAHHKLRPLQLQLQQEMLNKIGNNHLKFLQDSGGSGSLQSAGSNNSSMDRLLNYSNSSTPNAFVAESRNMFT